MLGFLLGIEFIVIGIIVPVIALQSSDYTDSILHLCEEVTSVEIGMEGCL